jgi:hypothetical protein
VLALLLGCGASLAACSAAQLASTQAAAVKFCTTDQPVIGTVATIGTAGVAAVDPAAAAAAPVVGLIVQDVNGVCNGLTAVPAPPAGTQVVVPAL